MECNLCDGGFLGGQFVHKYGCLNQGMIYSHETKQWEEPELDLNQDEEPEWEKEMPQYTDKFDYDDDDDDFFDDEEDSKLFPEDDEDEEGIWSEDDSEDDFPEDESYNDYDDDVYIDDYAGYGEDYYPNDV